jgi:type I restriction enzyme S subunit
MKQQRAFDWERVRLGDVCSVQGGFAFKSETYVGKAEGVPTVRIGDLQNGRVEITPGMTRVPLSFLSDMALQKYLLEPGDVLIAMTGATTGKLGRYPRTNYQPAFLNQRVGRLLPKNGATTKDFIFFSAQTRDFQRQVSGNILAAAQGNISPQKLESIQLLLPPFLEQRKIAAVLGLLRRAIEHQEQLMALTAELKKALLHKLFTTGLRGEPQKQTDIGLVPESWKVIPLSEVLGAELQNGAFVRRHQFGDGVCFANVVDMYRDTHLDVTQVERVRVDLSSSQQYLLNEGDVLIVRSSLKREGIGQNCVVGKLTEPAIYDCHLIRVAPDQMKIVPEFLSAYWRSPVGKLDLIQRSKTVTMTTINQMGISGALVPCPDISEQRDIVDLLLRIESKAKIHLRAHTALIDLFRTLLHQLMTAQIRVQDLDLSELEIKG